MSVGTAIFLIGAAVVLITLVPDFLAHVHRYRRYRRSYPAAPRGRVWKGTK